MAKQLVGPIERHVEKAVAGIAGLFLIGVVALYLVSSPNQINLGGDEVVSPGNIDAKLALKANQVREQLRAGKGKSETPAPMAEKFAGAIDPFKGSDLGKTLAGGVAMGPAVPIIDAPTVIEGSAKLVEILPLPKPEVHFGRSTLTVAAGVQAANWVTVASRFEVKKQAEMQALAYGETRRELIYADVQLQRRGQQADGSWSDGDWLDVETWPAPVLRDVPTVVLEDRGKNLGVSKEQNEAVVKFNEYLQDAGRQISILRPLFTEVVNGDKWKLTTLATVKELRIYDDEIRSPKFESEAMENRYGAEDLAAAVDPGKPAPLVNEVDQLLTEGQKLLAQATTGAECIEAYNRGGAVLTHPQASSTQKDKAQKLQNAADQKQRDIARSGPSGTKQDGPKKPRTLSAQQVVWAHDAAPDSVPSGKTLQYRIRMSLLNRLLGEPLLFRNKEDATVVFVQGAWSEPSDPIFVPATERFFITAGDEKKQEVNVEMFRWFDGVWVKARSKFGVGQKLTTKARVDVPIPDGVDHPMVEFTSDATIVDIDFKRAYREPKKGSGKGGVKFPAAAPECAVVLVDAAGNLSERVVASDKSHPDKAQIPVWTPKGVKTP